MSGRSVDATAALARRGFGIDVFVDRRLVPSAGPAPADAPAAGDVRVQSAHDFTWRFQRGQYDLIVYQIGNSVAHGFLWPYQLRYPGLAILHDTRLHHARGAALLVGSDGEAYREAFSLDHPDTSPDAAELGVLGFDGSYYFLWSMLRSVVSASRAVGVHARGHLDVLRREFPGVPCEPIALGMGREAAVDDQTRQATRSRLGVPADALLFGVFGGLTADKRVPQILRALARLKQSAPRAHLLLAGAPDRALPVMDLVSSLGLEQAVTMPPDLDDEAFENAIASVDVSLNLRWPTAGETSGPWVQALAAGRATVTIDHAHQAHVPALDPQNFRPRRGTRGEAPVTVAIDILDEDHSLRLAMLRLAQDERLRASLGAAGRRYWEREHTVTRMVDDYERLIRIAHEQPDPPPLAAALLRPDASSHVRRLTRAFGDLPCEFC